MPTDEEAPLPVPAAGQPAALRSGGSAKPRGSAEPPVDMQAVKVLAPSSAAAAGVARGGERRGGRGARERILRAAEQLFYAEGINTTGMERLTEVAQVSKRTFYQHFPSKNALVEEYLRRLDTQPVPRERVLRREDLPPRARLITLFCEDPAGGAAGESGGEPDDRDGARRVRARGCPFHNAAVELAGTVPAVEKAVLDHKEGFTQLLIDTARAAGATDPTSLGRQLTVLFEGATALSTTLNDAAPMADARSVALVLLEAALGTEA